MSKYLVIYNGSAGNSDNEKIAHHFQRQATAHGDADLLATQSRQEALQAIQKRAKDYDCLVTIGGDGTLNTTCTALLKANVGTTLGIIPGGTVNNFAKALGLPLEADAAIDTILTGTARPVDLGYLPDTGQAIVSSLTIGKLAETAQNVKQSEKKRWGPMIYLFKGFKQLVTNRSYKFRLTVNDQTHVQRAQVILITTTNSVGGFITFNQEASFDDDLLHTFVLRRFTPRKFMNYGRLFIAGKFKNARGVSYFKSTSLTIENLSHRPLHTRIDGDPSVKLPIKVAIRSDFIQVMTPN